MADVFDRPRPNAHLGVFETLLVLDGRPVELAAHLERLHRSLGELYGQDLPRGLADQIRERSRDTAAGKARVTASPSAAGVEVFDIPGDLCAISTHKSPTAVVSLHSLTLTGGLGAHKWADRSLLEGVQANLPAGTLPLIVDGDGALLEASRANLFAVRRGALFTPPLDGRILPGVTRARVIEIAAANDVSVHEEPLGREDLLRADEAFLTGSVGGIEPVLALDGATLGHSRAVSRPLAAELRRAWTGERTAAAFG